MPEWDFQLDGELDDPEEDPIETAYDPFEDSGEDPIEEDPDSENDGHDGGSGDDTLIGRDGDDEIDGGDGNDVIEGNGGDDLLLGDDGNDAVSGGPGNDVVSGDSGNDLLSGGPGDDMIDGGPGVDTVTYADATAGVNVDLGAGTASGDESVGEDTLTDVENVIGSEYDETIVGDEQANALTGLGGDDVIDGAGGADLLSGGPGNDMLDGGPGIDTVTYADATAGVNVDPGAGTASGDESVGNDTLTDIENVIGSEYDDTIVGDEQANEISGLGSNDMLDGGPGIDTVTYADATAGVNVDLGAGTASGDESVGNDTLTDIENVIGSEYDDTIVGDERANEISGLGGDDVIDGAGGDDLLSGGPGHDMLNGGPGIDTVTYADATAGVDVDLGAGTASGDESVGEDTLPDVENVIGSEYDDTIIGDEQANEITGLGGDDLVLGGTGDDVIDGGDGDDHLIGNQGDDVYRAGGGSDQLTGNAGDDTYVFGATDGSNTVTGFKAGDDTVVIEDDAIVEAFSVDENSLTIDQDGGAAVITVDGVDDFEVRLAGVDADDLEATIDDSGDTATIEIALVDSEASTPENEGNAQGFGHDGKADAADDAAAPAEVESGPDAIDVWTSVVGNELDMAEFDYPSAVPSGTSGFDPDPDTDVAGQPLDGTWDHVIDAVDDLEVALDGSFGSTDSATTEPADDDVLVVGASTDQSKTGASASANASSPNGKAVGKAADLDLEGVGNAIGADEPGNPMDVAKGSGNGKGKGNAQDDINTEATGEGYAVTSNIDMPSCALCSVESAQAA